MKQKALDLFFSFIVVAAIFLVVGLFVMLFTYNSDSNQNHESGDIAEEDFSNTDMSETHKVQEDIPKIINNPEPGAFEGGGSYAIYAEGYGLVGTANAYLNCSIAVSKPLEIYSAGYPISITLALNDAYEEFSLNAGNAKMLSCEGGSEYSVYLYVVVT